MAKTSLSYIGYLLAIIGGVIMVIFSLLGFLGLSIPFRSPLPEMFGGGIITLILGIIAIVGSKHAGELIWAIVLIIVGYIGGGIGGLLVLIGGLIGLLSRFEHRRRFF